MTVNFTQVNFTAEADELLELCIDIQQIPAPTGAEAQRARWVADYMRLAGFAEVQMDAFDNVYARVAGAQRGPALLVSAHTDTVFPASADLSIVREPSGARIFGPGLGDNSTGVAALLWLGKHLYAHQPAVDVWLVANTGEEGNGDLRGMRGAMDKLAGKLGASIVLEGMGFRASYIAVWGRGASASRSARRAATVGATSVRPARCMCSCNWLPT